MHLFTISFICYVFLVIEGDAKDGNGKGFQCQQNVPAAAEEAILGALNEQRNKLHERLGTIGYDCDLAKNAHEDIFKESSRNILRSERTYENSWNETLRKAVTSTGNNMVSAVKKIGCKIKLTTSPVDGSHNVELDCRLGDGDGKSPVKPMAADEGSVRPPRR